MAEIDCKARILGERGKDFELLLCILGFDYVHPSAVPRSIEKCIAVQKEAPYGTCALNFC